MKAIVKYPVEETEIRLWNGKKTCNVIVQDEAGLRYKLFAFEGSKAWELKEGEEIDVEVKEAAAVGKQGEVKLPGSGNGGKTFTRREYKTPTPEQAKEASDFGANLFKAMKGRMEGASDEAVARITAALIEKLC
jgi:hypothetical protein